MRLYRAGLLSTLWFYAKVGWGAPARPSSKLQGMTPRTHRKGAEAVAAIGSDVEEGGAVDVRGGGVARAQSALGARRAGVFAFTYAAYCVVYLVRKPVSVVKPMIQSDLGASTSDLAVVDTAWLTLYAIGQLSLGYFRSLAGPPLLLMVAFAGAGLSTALCSSAPSTSTLALFWGLNGLFQSCVNPLLVLHVAAMYPASARASAVGAWQTSQQIGGIGANFFAAGLLQRSGWRSIFAVSGAIAAAVAAPLRVVAADSTVAFADGPEATAKAAEAKVAAKGAKPKASPLALLKLDGVGSVCAAYFVVKMVRYCMMFWLPFFLVKAAGLPAAEAAKLATLLDLGGAAGGITVGLVADKLCGGAMVLACAPFAVLTAAFLVLHAQTYHLGIVANAACMLGVGFAVAAPDGILGGAVSRNLCEYNASPDANALAPAVAGLVNGCGSLGAILQGFGTAKLVDVLGWKGLFFSLAGLMSLAALILVPVIRLEAAALREAR